MANPATQANATFGIAPKCSSSMVYTAETRVTLHKLRSISWRLWKLKKCWRIVINALPLHWGSGNWPNFTCISRNGNLRWMFIQHLSLVVSSLNSKDCFWAMPTQRWRIVISNWENWSLLRSTSPRRTRRSTSSKRLVISSGCSRNRKLPAMNYSLNSWAVKSRKLPKSFANFLHGFWKPSKKPERVSWKRVLWLLAMNPKRTSSWGSITSSWRSNTHRPLSTTGKAASLQLRPSQTFILIIVTATATFSNIHPYHCDCSLAIARCYFKLSKTKEGVEKLECAFKHACALFDLNDVYFEAFFELFHANVDQQKSVKKACSVFGATMKILCDQNFSQSYFAANFAFNFANRLYDEGFTVTGGAAIRCVDLFEKSLEVFQNVFGSKDKRSGQCERMLGLCSLKNGDVTKAEWHLLNSAIILSQNWTFFICCCFCFVFYINWHSWRYSRKTVCFESENFDKVNTSIDIE